MTALAEAFLAAVFLMVVCGFSLTAIVANIAREDKA